MSKRSQARVVPEADEGPGLPTEGAETSHVESERALASDLNHLRHLLEQDAVSDARAYVRELVARWPDSDRVKHWARVLEPPRSRVVHGVKGRPLHRERAWLREHAHEYPGCWLAVYQDRLIAADPHLSVVLAATRASIGDESALLHFQPKAPDQE